MSRPRTLANRDTWISYGEQVLRDCAKGSNDTFAELKDAWNSVSYVYEEEEETDALETLLQWTGLSDQEQATYVYEHSAFSKMGRKSKVVIRRLQRSDGTYQKIWSQYRKSKRPDRRKVLMHNLALLEERIQTGKDYLELECTCGRCPRVGWNGKVCKCGEKLLCTE